MFSSLLIAVAAATIVVASPISDPPQGKYEFGWGVRSTISLFHLADREQLYVCAEKDWKGECHHVQWPVEDRDKCITPLASQFPDTEWGVPKDWPGAW